MRFARAFHLNGCALCAVLALIGCDERRQQQPSPESRAVSQDRIDTSLEAAQRYIDAGEFTKADAILMTLVERAPREVRARELSAQSLMLQAMQPNARGAADLRRRAYEQYKAALEIQPTSPGLQHSAGQVALAAGDQAAALSHFQRAESLDPENPQYPLFAAQVLIQQQQFQSAKQSLERVLQLDPDEPYAHASLAMISLHLGQFESAVDHIGRARQLAPEDLTFRAQQAKIHRRSGNPQRALELLIGLDPLDRAKEMVAYEIASSYELLNQPMKAAAAWQHVAQHDPLSPRAWFAAVKTGEYLLKAGQREQALLWLQQAQTAAGSAPEVIALEQAIHQTDIE